MPNKAAFYLARSAVGNLTQTRSADDPVLIDGTASDGGGVLPHRRQQGDRQGPSDHAGVAPARRRSHGGYYEGRRLMPVAATYSIAEVAVSLDCTPRWLIEQVRAGRFPAKKVGRHWRMTDQDIADALDICANDFRRPTADLAMVTGLTPRSRKKVASLLPTTASPRCSTVDRPDRRRRRAIQRSTPFTQSAEERHTIP